RRCIPGRRQERRREAHARGVHRRADGRLRSRRQESRREPHQGRDRGPVVASVQDSRSFRGASESSGTQSRPDDAARAPMGAILARAGGFLALWLVLAGVDRADLPAAAVAVGGATWASLRLLPPQPWHLQPLALLGLVVRFLRQSVVAGVDVAWRAL